MALDEVFQELRSIVVEHAPRLDLVSQTEGGLYLNTRHVMSNNKPLYFGGVEIRKKYVSYYLMPVYVYPELLDDISLELRQRMQGKSCFNFSASDPVMFAELRQLTRKGVAKYESAGYM